MMKKMLAVVGCLFVMGTTHLFAWGIGVQAGLNPFPWWGGIGGDLAVTFKLDSLPLVFAANATIGSHSTSVGATADYWFMNPNIKGCWNWYWGVGAYAGAGIGWNPGWASFDIGPRVLIGMNWFFGDSKFFELYTQLAAQPTFRIGDWDHVDLFDLRLPLNVGIRFWFN